MHNVGGEVTGDEDAELHERAEAAERLAAEMGARLREARKRARLSAHQVGEALGRRAQSVYRWEWGECKPQVEELIALASLYGTTVGWLANGECPAQSA